MRRISTLLLLLMISIVVYAVPAKPGLWKTIKLSDGTEVRAQLVGDEFGHFWQGADGKTYVKLPNTDYYSIADVETIKAKAQTRRQEANAQRMLRSPRNVVNNRRASSAVHKALILLVNFQDETFDSTHDNALFQRIANEEGFNEGDFKGSMKDYFKAQSLGQFILEFDVIGPLTVKNNRSYYGENNPSSNDNDKHPAEMVIEAVNMAKELITDWTPYDWDGDKYVDQVYVVYAGQGEADGGSDDTIWPHAWTLSSARYYGDGTGPVTVANNLKVNTYACGSELNGDAKICGIGTMCHEFSHCLGYPDYYDTDYSGGQGMGYWDLMSSGSYNGNGYQPAGYTSYERWTAGWITPTVLEDDNVTVENMKALQETGESYVIYNKGHRGEFFLLENRQPIGWDASLPGKGLLILHCDYDEDVWSNNKPNDDPNRQRMTWIPADNKYQYTTYQGSKYYSFDGMKNDPFPYGSVNSFSKNTTPAAEFYNKNSDGTYYMDSSVEDITQNNDSTVSFKFVANSTIVTPTDDYLFYESFNKCNGTGGNDGNWSSSIASATFKPDYNDWVTSNASGAYQCAKFGTSNKKGTATTPAFAVNGTATLTFRAAAWNFGTENTTLNLSVSNGSISPQTVTLAKGAWTDFKATISATGNVKVTFAAENEKNNRFFLDEVLVVESNIVPGDLDGSGSVSVSDVVQIIDVIAGVITDVNQQVAADVNRDGKVTITDCVAAIDLIAAQQASSPLMSRVPAMLTSSDYVSGCMQDDGLSISLNNENRYTAFQMIITVPDGMTLGKATIDEARSAGHQMTVRKLGDGQYLVVGFSVNNEELKGSNGRLFSIATDGQTTGDVVINNVEFVTADAKTHNLEGIAFSGSTTGITKMEMQNTEYRVYDLQGRRLSPEVLQSGQQLGKRKQIVIVNGKKVTLK